MALVYTDASCTLMAHSRGRFPQRMWKPPGKTSQSGCSVCREPEEHWQKPPPRWAAGRGLEICSQHGFKTSTHVAKLLRAALSTAAAPSWPPELPHCLKSLGESSISWTWRAQGGGCALPLPNSAQHGST